MGYLGEDSVIRDKFSKIKVIPLDMKKFNKELDEYLQGEIKKLGDSDVAPKFPEGVYFYVNDVVGFISGTKIVTDNECVNMTVEEDEPLTFDVYQGIINPEGGKSFSLIPTYRLKFKVSDLIKDYAMDEVDLPTFMGDRFNYNRRVGGNMEILLKEVTKKANKK